MKYLIIGHGRHGKDTLADLLPLSSTSSSVAAADIFLYDALKDKHGYTSVQECFEDRANHRTEWHDLIAEYNRVDPALLARHILQRTDIYCGMRSKRELDACKTAQLFDLIIWVDAPDRHPPEPFESMKLTAEDADMVITNNGTEAEFEAKVKRLIKMLRLGDMKNDLEYIADNWLKQPYPLGLRTPWAR